VKAAIQDHLPEPKFVFNGKSNKDIFTKFCYALLDPNSLSLT
jgi:hypothetical protein